MRYLPNTAPNQRAMLETIGVSGIEDLLVKIPAKARLARPLALLPRARRPAAARCSPSRAPITA